jgi:hypothetical protein
MRKSSDTMSLPQRTELARLLEDMTATVSNRMRKTFEKRQWVDSFGRLTPGGRVNAETARRSFLPRRPNADLRRPR